MGTMILGINPLIKFLLEISKHHDIMFISPKYILNSPILTSGMNKGRIQQF